MLTEVRVRRQFMVVDSSVSLKWILDDEEYVDQATALRDTAVEGHVDMVAPSLWIYEVTNGLVVATRRGRLSDDKSARSVELLQRIGVRFADPEAIDVHRMAIRLGIAAYDAAYLALASALDVPVWTGDRRLYDAVHRGASFVRWIGEYRR